MRRYGCFATFPSCHICRDFGAATEAVLTALSIVEDDRDALIKLAEVRADTGQYDDARTVYEGLITRFPEDDAVALAWGALECCSIVE